MTTASISEHFFNPENVGSIADAQAVARVGSVACGATLLFSMSVDGSQRISDAKFKSAGCSYLVAASSLLTERVKGKTTAEAAVLGQSPKEAVKQQRGDWPVDREHCAALACEALISAVKQYSDSVREEWTGDDSLICTCFGVSERTIENEIKAGRLQTIAEVTRVSNAGAGCRSCHSLIEDILDSMNSEW